MPSTSILVRCAFVALMLAGLVAVADSMARAQLTDAVKASSGRSARVVVYVADAAD